MTDMLKIYTLGTSASIPTKDRNLSSMLLNYRGVNYLFDIPENTQQQIFKVNQSLLKIKHIFITHFHGDHYFGILGLISSMALLKREEELFIYFPKGNFSFFENFLKVVLKNLQFKIILKEIKENQSFSFNNLKITSFKLDHSIICYGYVIKVDDKIGRFNKEKALKLNIPEGPLFQKLQNGQKIKLKGKTITPKQVIDLSYKKIGKKIVYMLDTFALKKSLKLFTNPDILIHECTFSNSEKEKARNKKHSYPEVVSLFAKKINAKKLYLTHLSSRYKDLSIILKESRKNFKNSFILNDLELLEINDY
jgi:ribonuclease Z